VRRRFLLVPALTLGLVLAGCGEDDGAGVRDIGAEDDNGSGGSPSGSGSGSASTPAEGGSPSGSPSAP
jgi:hypothetical protein